MNNINSLKRLFMKRFFFLVIMLGTSFSISAQKIDISAVNAKNSIYFEMAGHGGLYSINYERVLDSKLTLRAGVSYMNTSDGFLSIRYASIPLSFSELIPIDKDSFFEIGMFTTVFFQFHDNRLDTWIGPTIGFREQDLFQSRGMVKLFFSPFFITGADNKFAMTGGLAFGAGF